MGVTVNILKTLTLAAAVTVAGAMAATTVSAASISFSNEADTNGERAQADGSVVAIGGSTVTFWAGENTGAVFFPRHGTSAYLDAGSAGLGACSTVDGQAQCGTGSDDNTGSAGDVNTGYAEWVGFGLDGDSFLDNIIFRDRDHVLLGSFVIDLLFNGTYIFDYVVGPGGISAADLIANFGTNVLSDNSIIAFGRADSERSQDFYVDGLKATQVPLPAGGVLLLTALGGIGLIRRRRKAA